MAPTTSAAAAREVLGLVRKVRKAAWGLTLS